MKWPGVRMEVAQLCPRGKVRCRAALTKEPHGYASSLPPPPKGERSFPSCPSGQSRSCKGLLVPNVIFSSANDCWVSNFGSGNCLPPTHPERVRLAAQPGAISWWRFMPVVKTEINSPPLPTPGLWEGEDLTTEHFFRKG